MRLRKCITVVALLSILGFTLVAPCFADDPGNDGTPNPGDPIEDAPLCKTRDSLDPTAGQFSAVWMILMAMAFQLAL